PLVVPAVPTPASEQRSQTSAPAAPPASAIAPVELREFKAKGYHLDIRVSPEQIVGAAELLNQNGFAIDTITGVDWIASDEMEVVYDFFHPLQPLHVVVRTRLPRCNPEVPTIAGVFAGANWHERETHEFLGIHFRGHPNLTPLILPEDATYHPLRKD